MDDHIPMLEIFGMGKQNSAYELLGLTVVLFGGILTRQIDEEKRKSEGVQ